MIDPIELHDGHAGGEQDPAGRLRPYQHEMVLKMFAALSQDGTVFVGQAPPAFGKTVIIRAVTLGLLKAGKSVLITEPTYSRLEQLVEYLKGVQIEPETLLSQSRCLHDGLRCPYKDLKPNAIWCRETRKKRKCEDFSCEWKEQDLKAKEAEIGVAVPAALVYNDNWLDYFDSVVFDESHTLPSQVENARVASFGLSDARSLAVTFPGFDELGSIAARFEKYSHLSARTVGPSGVGQVLGGSVEELLEKLKAIFEDRPSSDDLGPEASSAYLALERLAYALGKSEYHRFTFGSGTVFASPKGKSMTFRAPHKEQTFKASIALISATIENPKYHVNDVGFPKHVMVPPYQERKDRIAENAERRIFSLIDGPNLRKGREDVYKDARAIANEVVVDVVSHHQYPTLILCRSGDDKDSIYQHLQEVPSVENRLFSVDDSAIEDADMAETLIKEKMESGRDLILATASSKLWEGADLRIRLLVIDALPYCPPDPWNPFKGPWVNSKTFRHMIRRLQQGIGRLIREENTWGVAVIIDGRLNDQWGLIRSRVPDYIKMDVSTTRQNRLVSEMESFISGAKERVATGKVRQGQPVQKRFIEDI